MSQLMVHSSHQYWHNCLLMARPSIEKHNHGLMAHIAISSEEIADTVTDGNVEKGNPESNLSPKSSGGRLLILWLCSTLKTKSLNAN